MFHIKLNKVGWRRWFQFFKHNEVLSLHCRVGLQLVTSYKLSCGRMGLGSCSFDDEVFLKMWFAHKSKTISQLKSPELTTLLFVRSVLYIWYLEWDSSLKRLIFLNFPLPVSPAVKTLPTSYFLVVIWYYLYWADEHNVTLPTVHTRESKSKHIWITESEPSLVDTKAPLWTWIR